MVLEIHDARSSAQSMVRLHFPKFSRNSRHACGRDWKAARSCGTSFPTMIRNPSEHCSSSPFSSPPLSAALFSGGGNVPALRPCLYSSHARSMMGPWWLKCWKTRGAKCWCGQTIGGEGESGEQNGGEWEGRGMRRV